MALKAQFSYRMKLFLSYSLVVAVLICGMIAFTYSYLQREYTENAKNEMVQSVSRIGTQVETLLREMNDISERVLYNVELKAILEDSLEHAAGNRNYFDMDTELKARMNGIFFSFIGINAPPRRLSVFNGKRNFYYLSTLPANPPVIRANLDEMPWLGALSDPDVFYVTLPPRPDPFAANPDKTTVISFIRKILRTEPSKDRLLGYVEVTQSYSMIESIVQSAPPAQPYDTRIWDSDGRLIYPYEPEGAGDVVQDIAVSEKNVVQYSAQVPRFGWTVMQAASQEELLKPVRRMQWLLLGMGLLLLAFTLTIVFAVTGYLTAPVKRLRRQLHSVTLESSKLDLNLFPNNNEIAWLGAALEKTFDRLKESMNLTIESRAREVQAHFQALQAQIDPHFLYNTLMSISAVAQESENERIVDMCDRLSNMLRYAGSFKQSIVTMREDMSHVRDYLEMLKVRYEDHLEIVWDLDEEIDAVPLPKLTLQPIVENAFAHGFSSRRSPYRIWISGCCSEHRWVVSIEDNGSGFDPGARSRLGEQIAAYHEDRNRTFETQPARGGIALINVYIRLYTLYGASTLFEIFDREGGGAVVRIGGAVNVKGADHAEIRNIRGG